MCVHGFEGAAVDGVVVIREELGLAGGGVKRMPGVLPVDQSSDDNYLASSPNDLNALANISSFKAPVALN